jgi:hypothetical protein
VGVSALRRFVNHLLASAGLKQWTKDEPDSVACVFVAASAFLTMLWLVMASLFHAVVLWGAS